MESKHIDVRIRQAVEADRQVLVALIVRAYADMRARQPGEVLARIWEDWEGDLVHTVDVSRVIIAEVDGGAVGFATFELNDATRIGTVDDNGVLPEYRNRGIGAGLLACVLERIEEAGMEFAQVSTGLEEPYAPARRMYERQGFVPLHSSICYVRDLAQSAT